MEYVLNTLSGVLHLAPKDVDLRNDELRKLTYDSLVHPRQRSVICYEGSNLELAVEAYVPITHLELLWFSL